MVVGTRVAGSRSLVDSTGTRTFNPEAACPSPSAVHGAWSGFARRIVPSVVALVAAALVAIVHMAFLVYMAFGGFLALRRFAWIWPHIGSTIYSVYVTITDFRCPATALEKWLLELGGRTPYEGSFIAHYLRDVLYPAQYETAVWLAAMGVAVLSHVVALTRRRRHTPQPDGLVLS